MSSTGRTVARSTLEPRREASMMCLSRTRRARVAEQTALTLLSRVASCRSTSARSSSVAAGESRIPVHRGEYERTYSCPLDSLVANQFCLSCVC